MNRDISITIYGNATILALLTIVLVLMPLHGVAVIGQAAGIVCGVAATIVHSLAAARIGRTTKADQ